METVQKVSQLPPRTNCRILSTATVKFLLDRMLNSATISKVAWVKCESTRCFCHSSCDLNLQMIRLQNGLMSREFTMLTLVATVMMFVGTCIVRTMGHAGTYGMPMCVTVWLGLMVLSVRRTLMNVLLITSVKMVQLVSMALILTPAFVLLGSLDSCKSLHYTHCHNLSL